MDETAQYRGQADASRTIGSRLRGTRRKPAQIAPTSGVCAAIARFGNNSTHPRGPLAAETVNPNLVLPASNKASEPSTRVFMLQPSAYADPAPTQLVRRLVL